MALQRWDPFSELNSLHEQVNSLFNETFGSVRGSLAMPTTDIYNNDKALTIEAHLPNFKEDEITIEQRDGELEIKAEHKEEEKEDSDRKYIMRESFSRYYRRFALPRNADTNNIQADFENGVLRVSVPFKELPKPQKIAIKAKNKSNKLQSTDRK